MYKCYKIVPAKKGSCACCVFNILELINDVFQSGEEPPDIPDDGDLISDFNFTDADLKVLQNYYLKVSQILSDRLEGITKCCKVF